VDFLRTIDIGSIAIQFAVFLFSLSIHEACHAWMADRCGDYTARYLGRVTLNPIPHLDPIGTILFPLLGAITHFPLIGWAKPVPFNPAHLKNPHRDQILISIAGPAANLLAGGAAFALLAVLKLSSLRVHNLINNGWIGANESYLIPILLMLYYAMIINLALAFFNIIPIPPLDGHWILYGLLPPRAAATYERMGSYGFIILYALMFMGIFRFILIPANLAQALLRSL
jgi:Zn-dependent protease